MLLHCEKQALSLSRMHVGRIGGSANKILIGEKEKALSEPINGHCFFGAA